MRRAPGVVNDRVPVASDLFPSRAAGSVAGFGGFKAGMVSIATAELTGRLLNANPGYYLPVFLVAAALYPISLACLTCPIRRWNERGCRARDDTQSRDPARAPGPPERDRLFVRARLPEWNRDTFGGVHMRHPTSAVPMRPLRRPE